MVETWMKEMYIRIEGKGHGVVAYHPDIFSEVVSPLVKNQIIPFLKEQPEDEIICILLKIKNASKQYGEQMVELLMLEMHEWEHIDKVYEHEELKKHY